eukprot:6171027-Pleurochrysis_carterae.AAC.1
MPRESPLRREAKRARLLGSQTVCEIRFERSIRWRESGTPRGMETWSLDQACAGVPRAASRTGSPWREPRRLKGGVRGGRQGKQLPQASQRQARTRWSAAQAPKRRTTAVVLMAAVVWWRQVGRRPTLSRRVGGRA